jgi:hypothetical protein
MSAYGAEKRWKMLSYLRSLGVDDLLLINPARGLRILRIIDFFWGVDGRLEILEQTARLFAYTVEQNLKGTVARTDSIGENISDV